MRYDVQSIQNAIKSFRQFQIFGLLHFLSHPALYDLLTEEDQKRISVERKHNSVEKWWRESHI
jgi:hypothetical protein